MFDNVFCIIQTPEEVDNSSNLKVVWTDVIELVIIYESMSNHSSDTHAEKFLELLQIMTASKRMEVANDVKIGVKAYFIKRPPNTQDDGLSHKRPRQLSSVGSAVQNKIE